ncbi:MAG: hypothetical protein ACQETH_14485 [Candidatus Rifleibacteriota bacterium]
MVRIDSLSAILVFGNLIAFSAFGLIGFDGDIPAIQKECQELERKLPLLKEKFNWANEARACIENPPEADSGQLLGRWTQMASRIGLAMVEASQITGKTPEIKLSGSGAFNNITMVLNSIAGEKAALVKRIRFEQVDERSWEFEIAVAVRNGPWEYYPTQEKAPAPEEVANENALINSGKPFARPRAVQVRAPAIKENIKYIGYFAEQATAAVIIEISGKFAVLKCGEKTPGGSVIKDANADELHLSKSENNGKETIWTVKMEKK